MMADSASASSLREALSELAALDGSAPHVNVVRADQGVAGTFVDDISRTGGDEMSSVEHIRTRARLADAEGLIMVLYREKKELEAQLARCKQEAGKLLMERDRQLARCRAAAQTFLDELPNVDLSATESFYAAEKKLYAALADLGINQRDING